MNFKEGRLVTDYAFMEPIIPAHDRIMAGVNMGEDGYIFLKFEDFLPEEFGGTRPAYSWKIFDEDMVLIHEEIDRNGFIRLGVNQPPNSIKALGSLLAFMSACAEAPDANSENWDLFTGAVREWCKENDTAIVTLMVDLENDDN